MKLNNDTNLFIVKCDSILNNSECSHTCVAHNLHI